jgi:hypothetical protein
MKKFAVGESDFKNIISDNYYYVDKSLFIKEILDRGEKVILIPRPRRFGKTLNITMLKYFYDCCPATGATVSPSPAPAGDTNAPNRENRELFASLAISKAGPQYLDKMGQHPVIFITFKNVKELDWTSCISNIKQIIQDEYLKNDYLLDSPVIKSAEKGYFKKIIDLEGSSVDYAKSLEKLLIFLSRHYGRKAVILIDEYDAPIHAGFTNQYYEDVISFMRNFLCGGLKDTGQYLEKGVLTGIMRVARESIFSGLNNPGVFTLLSEEFNNKFEKNMGSGILSISRYFIRQLNSFPIVIILVVLIYLILLAVLIN